MVLVLFNISLSSNDVIGNVTWGRSLFGIHFMTRCRKYILHLGEKSVQLRIIQNVKIRFIAWNMEI